MQNSDMWKYFKGESIVHKLNSTFKILSLFIMMICSFFINSFEDVIMVFSYLLLSLSYSGISIKLYLKELLYFIVLVILVVIIDVLSLSGIEAVVSDAFRVILVIMYISLFIHTTTVNEIMYGIEKILDPFDWQQNQKFTLYFALIFKFPNIFIREREKMKLAYKKVKRKSLKTLFAYYKNSIIAPFNSSISELCKMYDDMKMKLYGYGKSRTNYQLHNFGMKEELLLILNIVILIIVIFY